MTLDFGFIYDTRKLNEYSCWNNQGSIFGRMEFKREGQVEEDSDQLAYDEFKFSNKRVKTIFFFLGSKDKKLMIGLLIYIYSK